MVFITTCVYRTWRTCNFKSRSFYFLFIYFLTLRKVVGMFYFSVISVTRGWLWCRVLQMGSEMHLLNTSRSLTVYCTEWWQMLRKIWVLSSKPFFIILMIHPFFLFILEGFLARDEPSFTILLKLWSHLFPLASSQDVNSMIRLIACEQLFSTSFMLWKANPCCADHKVWSLAVKRRRHQLSDPLV